VLLRHVARVRTGVSEEPSASTIRMTRIGELETTLAVTSNRLRCEEILIKTNAIPRSPILVKLMMKPQIVQLLLN
jgi:hypothetical protein